MPEEIMVESWRVMTVSSAGLMRWKRLMSPLKRVLLLAQLHGLQALLLQRCLGGVRGCGLELALGRDAGPVDGLVGEDCGAHYAATGIRPCTRRRISAGCEERDSAVAIVILPALTSPASEESMVCIPCSPPVWIRE